MSASLEHKRNIAILAHVNAGKTTVSERLLYFSSAISGTGEVDEGLATMDYLEEERRRGITIEAGIASYTWKGTRVTFVDTPGHVDFGAEVDFALQSVEGVVLVVSGTGGVESQTLAAWEKLRANGNVPLVFINKVDIPGADHVRALEQIRVLFKTTPVVMNFPVIEHGMIKGVVDVAHELALFRSEENPRQLIKGEVPESCHEEYIRHRQALLDFSSRHNDAVLSAWMEGGAVSPSEIIAGVREGARKSDGVPVFMGSALKNAGVRQLLNGINQMLPAPAVSGEGARRAGFVLKARWYPGIGRISLVKVFAPRLMPKSIPDAKYFTVFAETLEPVDFPEAGDIVAVSAQSLPPPGTFLGATKGATAAVRYKPLLQARIEPVDASDHGHIQRVLAEISGTEPSIKVATDPATGGWIIRTVGELQLDVFCRRLRNEHGCNIRQGTPVVAFHERLKRSCRGLRGSTTAFGATVSLEFDAKAAKGEEDNIIRLPGGLNRLEAEILQDCFRSFCAQGVCGKGEITGLQVELTSLEGSLRPVPPPLLAKAFSDALGINLDSAKFDVFEPIMNLEIIVPEEFCGGVLSDLSARGGVIRKVDADGRNSIIFLEIPLENVFGYATLLRSLSKGLGVFVLTYLKHGVRKRG